VKIVLAAMVMTAVAMAAAQDPQQLLDKGEQIQNGACISCHDLRPIQTASMDKDEWTKTVENMVEKGAKISAPDLPLLIDYLVASHGPLPEGAGKKIMLNTCTVCHDLQRIKRTQLDRDGWEDTLSAMLNEGAMLSEEDFPVLLSYLARYFR
jgi:cytochrome c5